MKKEITISIDEILLENALSILDSIGLSFESIVNMALTSLVREQGIMFLLNTEKKLQKVPMADNRSKDLDEHVKDSVNKAYNSITKSRAISLFRGQVAETLNSQNVTFASKNKSSYNYWANPSDNLLYNDWFLILNDWINRELYLFKIPASSITPSELTHRADRSEVIDLQIAYNDSTFTDERSNLRFLKYSVKKISY